MASGDQSKQRKLEILNKLSHHRSDIAAKKQVLNEQIAESKELFTSQIKDKIDVPKMLKSKVTSSFTSNPNKWFAGSVAGGLILSRLIFRKNKKDISPATSVAEQALGVGIRSIFRRPKKRPPTHGIFYSLMGYASRPLFKAFVMGKVRTYANKIIMQQAQRPREVYYEEHERYPESNSYKNGPLK